jgi:hypothetical protein
MLLQFFIHVECFPLYHLPLILWKKIVNSKTNWELPIDYKQKLWIEEIPMVLDGIGDFGKDFTSIWF